MSDAPILLAIESHVAVITLNRPEKLNAFAGDMRERLVAALDQVAASDARVLVITGAGRAFCAGLDLVDATQGSVIGSDKQVSTISVNLDLRNTPPTVLFAMDKPTICSLTGSAAGYGMDTAMGCDIRIAGESAKMAAAFVKRGVVPESGGTWILPRLLGWAKAAELIFTGRTLSARESLELGLVNHVVPDAELAAKTREIALEMAANAPLAVQAIKELALRGPQEGLAAGLRFEQLVQNILQRTEDAAEGRQAFAEKRSPRFTGN